jgi:hypothetical protein
MFLVSKNDGARSKQFIELSSQTPSYQIPNHPFNLTHVVMRNSLFGAIVPFNRYASPIRFCDCALIASVVLPTNRVADFEGSGLAAGHFTSIGSRPLPKHSLHVAA